MKPYRSRKTRSLRRLRHSQLHVAGKLQPGSLHGLLFADRLKLKRRKMLLRLGVVTLWMIALLFFTTLFLRYCVAIAPHAQHHSTMRAPSIKQLEL